MWRIHYTAAGEKTVRVDTVATEAEMLTAVRHVYRSPEFCVQWVEGPQGKKLSAAQVSLFSMLLNTKPGKVAAKRNATPQQPDEAPSPGVINQASERPGDSHHK